MPENEHREANSSGLSAVGSPLRTCIVTRAELPKEALIRFVVSPEGRLVADLAGKLPGRGIYVTCSRLLLAEALSKRLFSRAAKEQVQVPEGFLQTVESQMLARVCEALSMARKGGLVVAGFEKVEEALKSGTVVALLHAEDAGADGVRKLAAFSATYERTNSNGDALPTYSFLPRGALSHATGHENTVHAAVRQGAAAAFFLAQARRFALFLE